MKRKLNKKKIFYLILAIAIIIGIIVLIARGKDDNNKENEAKYKVVTTNFVSYDFLRAIIGNNKSIELTFLLGPGKDAHSYEPTAQDLVKIQEADLFVYVGGEMEEWASKVIMSMENMKSKIIRITNYVDSLEETEIDGVQKDEEEIRYEKNHPKVAFDEHVWTSPENAKKIVERLEQEIERLDSANANYYLDNAKKYINQIEEVDQKIREIVENKVRNRLVFADKMPMRYFIDYYGLEVTAAFEGCSNDIEPSAKTIAYIQDKIKEEKIPVVLYIELNPGTVAQNIAKDTGTQALQIQTLHNISLEDFEKGETWVSLMKRNIEVLKKALQ